jgi:hypothetical protein
MVPTQIVFHMSVEAEATCNSGVSHLLVLSGEEQTRFGRWTYSVRGVAKADYWQKTLNTSKCTKSFFINYNTLLHVSTLLGHLQGENFRCRYTRLHCIVQPSVTTTESFSLKMIQQGRNT